MALFRNALLIVLTAVAIHFLPYLFSSKLPHRFDGFANSKFKLVQDAFRQNFEKGWEHEGAAISVYHKGELVVDLWGGYADESSMRPWKEDTMTIVFSSTKAVAALCVAKLVDQGLISYDDLVTKYWPEFGKNGKDKVTVSMLMNHQAGLAALDSEITVDHMKDHNLMSKLYEEQKPNWVLGTTRSYHALTFGWLSDQLVRRIDKKHRSVGQFFSEEIAKPNGIEFYIGLPSELEYKVTRVAQEGFNGVLGQMWDDHKYIGMVIDRMISNVFDRNNLFKRILSNAKWLTPYGRISFNNPEFHQIEIPAANGIGTARGLAKLFSLVAEGSLLSENTVKILEKPVSINQYDSVLLLNVSAGYGFMHTKPYGFKNNNFLFGHPGFGGSSVKVDVKNQLAFAYITNGLKPGMGDIVRTYAKLQRALYSCL